MRSNRHFEKYKSWEIKKPENEKAGDDAPAFFSYLEFQST
jgi:hypothetical protein